MVTVQWYVAALFNCTFLYQRCSMIHPTVQWYISAVQWYIPVPALFNGTFLYQHCSMVHPCTSAVQWYISTVQWYIPVPALFNGTFLYQHCSMVYSCTSAVQWYIPVPALFNGRFPCLQERCFQYWPEKVHTSVEYGKYHISTVAEEADSVSVTRTLKIKNAEVRDGGDVMWEEHGMW